MLLAEVREMESNLNEEATMNPRWTGLAKFSSVYLRIMGVETGGCPHTAIREDASMNLGRY
jgi:hypothetical protein